MNMPIVKTENSETALILLSPLSLFDREGVADTLETLVNR